MQTQIIPQFVSQSHPRGTLWNSTVVKFCDCSKPSVILLCMIIPSTVYYYLNKVYVCMFVFLYVSVLNMQNLKPEVEELIFCHYVVCNDTQETLCFGQVDTDESVVLSSGQSHQYCWRSHKAPQVTVSLCHLHLAVLLFTWMHAHNIGTGSDESFLAKPRTVMQM